MPGNTLETKDTLTHPRPTRNPELNNPIAETDKNGANSDWVIDSLDFGFACFGEIFWVLAWWGKAGNTIGDCGRGIWGYEDEVIIVSLKKRWWGESGIISWSFEHLTWIFKATIQIKDSQLKSMGAGIRQHDGHCAFEAGLVVQPPRPDCIEGLDCKAGEPQALSIPRVAHSHHSKLLLSK